MTTLPFREHHLIQLLNGYDQANYPLDLYVSFYFKDNPALGSKDRREISDLVYALMRWKTLLDQLSGSTSWQSRLYAYKKYYPFDSEEIRSLAPYTQVSFPEALFNFIEKSYGTQEALHLCKISNTKAPTTIRVNALKTTREALLKEWEPHYPVSPCQKAPFGIIFHEKIHFFSMKEFQSGLFEIQDEGSQLVADMVHATPGSQVLDYCAGSGGKALAIAPKLQGKGQIYLHDVRKRALEEARKRLKRAGIQNCQTMHSSDKNLEKLKKKMDFVLVDAPCSGTGTLRRNPDMKWRFQEESIKNLVGEQRMIFERALSFVKPSGYIIYATCSLLKDENEHQTEHFLKTYPLAIAEPPFKSLPSLNGMDGFYAVLFQKKQQHLLT